MKYSYPLKLKFQIIALAPRISVIDANAQEIFYIEQKVFALKEAIKVFNNSKDKQLQYTIKADQIIDFGAKYYIHTADEKLVGSVQQDGVKSLFKGSYSVFDANESQLYKITQSNPWISLLDSIVNMIPFAELVTGYVLNPAYIITAKDNPEAVLSMKKRPSLFEATFEISTTNANITEQNELLVLLTLLMIVQLERNRG